MNGGLWRIYDRLAAALPAALKQRLRQSRSGAEFFAPIRFRLQAGLARLAFSGRPSGRPLIIQRRPWSGPLVSVIVTCYNYGRYLDRLFAALAAQSWHDFEIILIDDGSDDPETVARLDELERQTRSGLTVIRQANQGVVAARNRAVAAARGCYIFPLDADDTIEKTFLEKTLFFLENSPETTFVYSWTRSTGTGDFIWPTRDCPPAPVLGENRMGYAVIRKSAFDRVGGYHPAMADGYEDWELCVNLVAHGYCGRAIPEPLYNYYVKPGARNSRAGRRHQELVGRIAARHETALRARWRILTSQARLSFQVENYLVNLVPAGNAPAASCWLFDCAQERVWFRPAGTLLKKLAAFARARSRDRVMVLLARPQLNLFLEAQPANLYFYSPREYHPNRKEAPFRRYLEARYRPRRLALRELEKL